MMTQQQAKQYTYALVLFVLVTIFSCSKSDSFESQATLAEYFARFEDEAALRGVSINLNESGVTGRIVDIPDEHVAGKCKWSSVDPSLVTIDKEFWSKSSDLNKEYIVFHELGHCMLERIHRDEADEEGKCLSIMASSNQICQTGYNTLSRDQYLDELFTYEQ